MEGGIPWHVIQFRTVSSTQDLARELATRGLSEGTVVLAAEQTAGRGRRTREWASPKGGLYMSVILRPRRETGVELLPFVGALAALEGVRKESGVASRLRWPNDLMVDGRKLGGVIAEASFLSQSLSYVTLGIGVNCNFRAQLLKGIGEDSVTLLGLTGGRTNLGILSSKILESLESLYSIWSEGKDELVAAQTRASLSTLGHEVIAKLPSGMLSGAAADLRDDGSLVVESGKQRVVIRAENTEWLREKQLT